jgi:hypothetical protein
MSSKFLKIIFATVLSVGLVGQSNAGLIVGENYTDADNVLWAYVGQYDLISGPAWGGVISGDKFDNATPYNGLEAAVAAGIISGPLEDIAISAFERLFQFFDLPNINAGAQIVNHSAWYDGSQAAIAMFSENIIADGDGDGYYTQGTFPNGQTDRSAWVLDRGGNPGTYINYVFKRVSVPEPSTFAIFTLALLGLGARQLKK